MFFGDKLHACDNVRYAGVGISIDCPVPQARKVKDVGKRSRVSGKRNPRSGRHSCPLAPSGRRNAVSSAAPTGLDGRFYRIHRGRRLHLRCYACPRLLPFAAHAARPSMLIPARSLYALPTHMVSRALQIKMADFGTFFRWLQADYGKIVFGRRHESFHHSVE